MIGDGWGSCQWPNEHGDRCNQTAVTTREAGDGYLVNVCDEHVEPDEEEKAGARDLMAALEASLARARARREAK